ncbi:MAG: glycosyltransferase family 4 protein [Bacteroidetes bacterium]|nr:glycosyltransferase family 4 protein [Bacteroidota bacterium]
MAGRQRICHLSVLNPVAHPRIFEKQALPASIAGHLVYILAAGQEQAPVRREGVCCWAHPMPRPGQWGRRIRIQGMLLWRCLRIKPHICHVHTPELLGIAWLLKWLLGCHILYDKHEDYAANLRYSAAYPGRPRALLAMLITLWEHIAVCWTDHVVYAEAIYDGSLPQKSTVYANRVPPNPYAAPKPGYPPIRLLVTGTLAPDWGTGAAIELFLRLQETTPCTLTLAGYAPDSAYAEQLYRRCTELGITLIGGKEYVPHPTLLQLMRIHHLGLALYQLNPAIRHKVPTCFYEYMAAGLPFLFSPNPHWEQLNHQTGMGMAATLHPPASVSSLLAAYQQPDSSFWRLDPGELLCIYDNLT